jgi:2-iminobutanoate/2-iminopropanoate deaminase
MSKQILSSDKIAKPFGIFSTGVKTGGLVFVSGQVSQNAEGEIVGKGDVRTQTRQCLDNMRHVLEAAGATLKDVVKMTVYVTDMKDLNAIHEIRAEYFKKEYPASTLVQVSALTKQEYLIEIEAIAVIQ